MSRRKFAKKRLYLVIFLLLVVIGIIEGVVLWRHVDNSPNNRASSSVSKSNKTASTTSSGFDKSLYPTSQASSLWVVVNKGRVLPSSYVPADLVVPNIPLRLGSSSLEMHVRSDTAAALEQMAADANKVGIHLMLASGYRSYSNQVATYNGFVNVDGVAKADTYSARPGHSEHQTGLAADLEPTSRQCEVQQCFGDLPEGKWLAANAYKYGFMIRYTAAQENLTGYEAEPWHVRYVGVALAAQIHQTGQTLEQFFGLPSYTSYPSQPYQLQ